MLHLKLDMIVTVNLVLFSENSANSFRVASRYDDSKIFLDQNYNQLKGFMQLIICINPFDHCAFLFL
jgi:hypothetical protein